MSIRFVCFGLLGAGALCAATVVQNQDGPVVHEWGTFTSVAGAAGEPVLWQPLAAPPDLPCFVNRLNDLSPKTATAYVRMETPVIYFYTPRALSVTVGVRFPQGMITEWYPPAASVQPSAASPQFGMAMEWKAEIDPEAQPRFPMERRPSRYYAARETDAAPLRAGSQQEKLIFYRGIGNFNIALRPRFAGDGALEVSDAGIDPVREAILFENRGGKIAWRPVNAPERESSGDLAALRGRMEQILAGEGLFPKEARAMLETWRDSWFEDGARVLYIVPRAQVDAVLPLTIDPAPVALARVFVGRIEMKAPWMAKEIDEALAADDPGPLAKYGRFLPALGVAQLRALRPRVRAFLDASYQRLWTDAVPHACQ
jgi:hypothetical protein